MKDYIRLGERPLVFHLTDTVFFPIPKVASTSFTKAMQQYGLWYSDREYVYLNCGDWTKIVVLRDPFERAVSHFNHVQTNNLFAMRFDEWDIHRRMSFDEYVDVIANVKDEVADEHFRSQTAQVMYVDEFMPNVIIPLNRAHELGDYFPDIEIPWMNSFNHRPHLEYYNDDTYEKVAARYSQDLYLYRSLR